MRALIQSASEIVVVSPVCPGGCRGRSGLTDDVREGFHIPMTIFEIDRGGRVPAPASGDET